MKKEEYYFIREEAKQLKLGYMLSQALYVS